MERFVTPQAGALVRNSEGFTKVLNGKSDVGHFERNGKLNDVGKVSLDSAKEKSTAEQSRDRHSDRDPKDGWV